MTLKRALERRDRVQALTLNLVESDPWVPIRLGGHDLKLEYSYDAVSEVFRETGIDIAMTDITMRHIGDPRVFPVLLDAGLRTHHDGLLDELTDVGSKATSLVPMRHLNYVHTCIMLALQAAAPDPAEVQRILDELPDDEVSQQQELPLQAAPDSDASGLGAPTLV